MFKPILWEPVTPLATIHDLNPQLASWDKKTHPSQLRLQAYRQPVIAQLTPFLPESDPLYLHLDVDVAKPEHLLRHHDLENYLTPLFGLRYLPPARFVLVTARKFFGGGSRLEAGIARPASIDMPHDWQHFAYTAHESLQSKQWKENLRTALAASTPLALSAPAVEVQIAWRCSPRRNWTMLWKPTGDCMGPILGEDNPLRPFSPNDDRIVELKYHCALDITMGNHVQVDMWWRSRP